jgi:hypothetical protein
VNLGALLVPRMLVAASKGGEIFLRDDESLDREDQWTKAEMKRGQRQLQRNSNALDGVQKEHLELMKM